MKKIKQRLLFEQTESLRLIRVRDYRPLFLISFMINVIVILGAFTLKPNEVTKYKNDR